VALPCTIFDVFDFEKYCNLEIQVRGHSISLKLESFDSLPMVSYKRPIITVSKMHHFFRYSPLNVP